MVASEVKSLASQTARATEQIAGQVAAMQGATNDTLGAIHSNVTVAFGGRGVSKGVRRFKNQADE